MLPNILRGFFVQGRLWDRRRRRGRRRGRPRGHLLVSPRSEHTSSLACSQQFFAPRETSQVKSTTGPPRPHAADERQLFRVLTYARFAGASGISGSFRVFVRMIGRSACFPKGPAVLARAAAWLSCGAPRAWWCWCRRACASPRSIYMSIKRNALALLLSTARQRRRSCRR